MDHDLELAPARDRDLPEWDLSDLYPAPDSPEIEADLAAAAREGEAFAQRYRGKLARLSGEELGRAVAAYEAIEERLGRLMAYAQLHFAALSTDPERGRFYQRISERVTAISSLLLFFTLELNRLDEGSLEKALAAPALARYRPWLEELRVFRPHQLDEPLERLLHEKEVTGPAAWTRLFDETMAALRVDFEGEAIPFETALEKLSERNRSRREAAAHGIAATLGRHIRLLSFITNTLAKDKEIVDTWRRYPHPWSFRHRANMVEDEVIDALEEAVVRAYPRLSHRYYTLKAGWLGLPKLAYWDRNAPLPEADDRYIPWSEAVGIVREAYARFSPTLAEYAAPFFDRPWIDAPPRPGKAGGAFAHPTVPSAHPYLLLNYHGRPRDVMTLAHELGHGVHQRLAARQGHLLSQTPLTLAETASVFGEMLTFRALLDAESDPRRKRLLLANKVEDMLNTVVRQIAFYRFEKKLHLARRKGELLPEEIGALWLEVQSESLGPAFDFAEEYRLYWSYIPHFVHTPFYVYAYAFGDCLVNALYRVYESGHPGFVEKYLDLLAAGGTRRHREALAPFGLDATDPAFWTKGLEVIGNFIDMMENLPA
jgi:oligoendopeptidase F